MTVTLSCRHVYYAVHKYWREISVCVDIEPSWPMYYYSSVLPRSIRSVSILTADVTTFFQLSHFFFSRLSSNLSWIYFACRLLPAGYLSYFSSLTTEAVCFSETSVNFYPTIRLHIPNEIQSSLHESYFALSPFCLKWKYFGMLLHLLHQVKY
jgi:hypothetical protein